MQDTLCLHLNPLFFDSPPLSYPLSSSPLPYQNPSSAPPLLSSSPPLQIPFSFPPLLLLYSSSQLPSMYPSSSPTLTSSSPFIPSPLFQLPSPPALLFSSSPPLQLPSLSFLLPFSSPLSGLLPLRSRTTPILGAPITPPQPPRLNQAILPITDTALTIWVRSASSTLRDILSQCCEDRSDTRFYRSNDSLPTKFTVSPRPNRDKRKCTRSKPKK